MKACRVLVNTLSAVWNIMYNELIPSLTLGCASYGKNSISHNVSATHLLTLKRLLNDVTTLTFQVCLKFILKKMQS